MVEIHERRRGFERGDRDVQCRCDGGDERERERDLELDWDEKLARK